jgi:dTDP-4-amino-4,6-dideoxygalactose transaminase
MAPAIPQTDPRAEYIACRAELEAALHSVLERGRYILGEEVKAFEQEFAAYLGAPFAIGVASGTDALQLALRACGVGAGDEVITVAHTAVATIVALEQCGATPVLVDVDDHTFTLAPDALVAALTSRTKAIVPVHLYGQPADMATLLAFAREHQLLVVEDCAQAHGAACRLDGQWRKAGTLGDAAAFSFYPTKNLGAVGDGGCVVTTRPDVVEQVRLLREYGWRERYVSSEHGLNSRLDELQAALLRVKLRRLDEWNEARRQLATVYDRALRGTPVVAPVQDPNRRHVFHQYVLRLPERDRVRAALAAAGVGTGIHYPVPVHLQPAYHALGLGAQLAVTEKICDEIISLPMYPYLAPASAEHVAQQVRLAVATRR